jgi:hypothetical protein
MKKNKSTIILILVFFVGLSVMLYPTISDYVNQRNQSRAVANYAQDVDNMTDADYSAYFDAADAFNAQVAANENALYRPDQLSGYNETLDITGTGIMGYITISKIGVELPIYHGTSDSVLQIAAGHLEGTAGRRRVHPRGHLGAPRPAQRKAVYQPRPAGSGRYLYHHRAGPGAHLRGGQNLHRAAHRDR